MEVRVIWTISVTFAIRPFENFNNMTAKLLNFSLVSFDPILFPIAKTEIGLGQTSKLQGQSYELLLLKL